MVHRFARQVAASLTCWALATVALVPPAHAGEARTEDTERAEAKVVEAKAFFKSQLFRQAATSYLQAYAISRKPATLFNAARSYEEAGLPAEAMALFEQYRQLPDVPADGRKDAEERIARNRVVLAAAVPAKTEAVKTEAVKVEPPKPEPTTTEPAKVEPTPTEPAIVQTTPAPLVVDAPSKALSWGLFAGGDVIILVGLLGYGGAVGAVNTANAMDFSALGAEAKYKTDIATAKSTRNFSVGALIVGAGLAGWGAWRLWGPSSSSAPATPSAAWVAPMAGTDTTGVTVGGRF